MAGYWFLLIYSVWDKTLDVRKDRTFLGALFFSNAERAPQRYEDIPERYGVPMKCDIRWYLHLALILTVSTEQFKGPRAE